MFLKEQINSKKGAKAFQLNPLNQECQKKILIMKNAHF